MLNNFIQTVRNNYANVFKDATDITLDYIDDIPVAIITDDGIKYAMFPFDDYIYKAETFYKIKDYIDDFTITINDNILTVKHNRTQATLSAYKHTRVFASYYVNGRGLLCLYDAILKLMEEILVDQYTYIQ